MSTDDKIMGMKCEFKKPSELTDVQLAGEIINVAFVEVRLAFTAANDLPGDYRLNFGKEIPELFTVPNLEPLIKELNERVIGPARPNDSARTLLTALHAKVATVPPSSDIYYKALALRTLVDGPDAAAKIEQGQLAEVWLDEVHKQMLKIVKPPSAALH